MCSSQVLKNRDRGPDFLRPESYRSETKYYRGAECQLIQQTCVGKLSFKKYMSFSLCVPVEFFFLVRRSVSFVNPNLFTVNRQTENHLNRVYV